MITPTAEQIIAINARHLGGQAAVRDAGQVASAAMRPDTFVFGEELFPSLPEKVAAIMHSLICSHPFLDANKRTAWTVAEACMIMNGMSYSFTNDQAFALVMRVAENCSQIDVKDIARELEHP